MCPFLHFNGRCIRKRYQTTVNATMAQVRSATRHLLMDDTPLLLTIDASNHEAMQALANQISYYELRLEEPFQVLGFLRDELAAQAALEEAEQALIQNASAADSASPTAGGPSAL